MKWHFGFNIDVQIVLTLQRRVVCVFNHQFYFAALWTISTIALPCWRVSPPPPRHKHAFLHIFLPLLSRRGFSVPASRLFSSNFANSRSCAFRDHKHHQTSGGDTEEPNHPSSMFFTPGREKMKAVSQTGWMLWIPFCSWMTFLRSRSRLRRALVLVWTLNLKSVHAQKEHAAVELKGLLRFPRGRLLSSSEPRVEVTWTHAPLSILVEHLHFSGGLGTGVYGIPGLHVFPAICWLFFRIW